MTPAWDARRYQDQHSYVWQLGGNLLELLQPRAGERILDIGCGTGQLTADIAGSGARVTGLDSSPDMIEQARRNYPDIPFVLGDAASFSFPEQFDAIFSNAALHWVPDHQAVAGSIARALLPGGRFVAEFGGKGCIASITAAMLAVLGPYAAGSCPWNFRSIGEFAPLLERAGMEVCEARLFDRPTPVQGDDGMEGWLRMFCGGYFGGLTAEETRVKLCELVAQLRPALYNDGVWTLDYRRLRIVAIKTA
jgi:trans-aconitate methyltransferase